MEKKKAHHNFNHRPLGWVEIEEKEFYRQYFMHYCLDERVLNQIYYNEENSKEGLFDAFLFDLSYSGEVSDGLGVAIAWDWKENNRDGKAKYFRYGDPDQWMKFRGEFAAQFAGDNS